MGYTIQYNFKSLPLKLIPNKINIFIKWYSKPLFQISIQLFRLKFTNIYTVGYNFNTF
ncbi:hypothetical protein BANRA_03454 [Klebsiella pneumoniae]|nr:hypothetical protein BANRA_03454 [Klebsiella pneumoniae]